jgi:hypothetical protein
LHLAAAGLARLALRPAIKELIALGMLRRAEGGGRSTGYELAPVEPDQAPGTESVDRRTKPMAHPTRPIDR